MELSSEKVIAYIEQGHPNVPHQGLKNGSDLNFRVGGSLLRQIIIGLTPSDKFTVSILSYEHRMKESLSKLSNNVDCFAFPFQDNQLEQVRIILNELSSYYKAELNIEKMIQRLNIDRDKEATYYIIITVIRYQVIDFE